MKSEMNTDAVRIFPVLETAKTVYYHGATHLTPSWNENVEDDEWIELYHGTDLEALYGILANGLKPNANTRNNWDNNELRPLKNAVYLTDKWHFFFAAAAFSKRIDNTFTEIQALKKKQAIQDYIKKGINRLNTESNFPVYLKVRVKKKNIIADEDYFLSKKMNTHFEKALKEQRGIVIPPYKHDKFGVIPPHIFNGRVPQDQQFYVDAGVHNYNQLGLDGLKYTGTCAVIGEIPVEDILEVRLIPSLKVLDWSFLNQNHKYAKDYHTWQQGLGRGTLQKAQIKKMELELGKNDLLLTERLQDIQQIEMDYQNDQLHIIYK